MTPFLKWPGGKRWLVSKYPDIFPNEYGTYFEPFLGGGSVFFHLMPEQGVVSDTNRELINTYHIMAKNPALLRILLEEHQENHSVEYYYDVDMFEEYAHILHNIHIRTQDFVATIRNAGDGDLVFVDPPYATTNKQNCFIMYNEKLFSWRDQTRLLNALVKARARGAIIISTNVLHQQLQQMYQQNGFYTQILNRFSSISGSATGRGQLDELLITSYPVNLI